MTGQDSPRPDWNGLYEVAASQAGLFTSNQAKELGVSRKALSENAVEGGKLRRVRRAIYRLAQFPNSDHEDLVAIWLWADQRGVFSHETALALRNLSDALPARIHLTLPISWDRRLRRPSQVVFHFADVPDAERDWIGPVPVTSTLRTISDCVQASVPQEFITAAINQALDRGLASAADLAKLQEQIAKPTRARRE